MLQVGNSLVPCQTSLAFLLYLIFKSEPWHTVLLVFLSHCINLCFQCHLPTVSQQTATAIYPIRMQCPSVFADQHTMKLQCNEPSKLLCECMCQAICCTDFIYTTNFKFTGSLTTNYSASTLAGLVTQARENFSDYLNNHKHFSAITGSEHQITNSKYNF